MVKLQTPDLVSVQRISSDYPYKGKVCNSGDMDFYKMFYEKGIQEDRIRKTKSPNTTDQTLNLASQIARFNPLSLDVINDIKSDLLAGKETYHGIVIEKSPSKIQHAINIYNKAIEAFKNIEGAYIFGS